MFELIANSIGIPEGKFYFYKDQVRMIILILSSFPIGFVNYFIKNIQARLWYGFLTGLIIQYLMYGFGNLQ